MILGEVSSESIGFYDAEIVWGSVMNLDELVSEFADCVAAQSEAIAMRDPDTGNKFAKRYVAAFEKLHSHGDRGPDALAALIANNRPEVRVMAASYLLRHCENRARAVLDAEAKGNGIVAFGAAQALQRWKEGTWNLDPE